MYSVFIFILGVYLEVFIEHLPRASRPNFIVWVRSHWSGRDQHSMTELLSQLRVSSATIVSSPELRSLGTWLRPQIYRWQFARTRPPEVQWHHALIFHYILSLFEWRLEVFRLFVVVSAQNFDDWLTHWHTDWRADASRMRARGNNCRAP